MQKTKKKIAKVSFIYEEPPKQEFKEYYGLFRSGHYLIILGREGWGNVYMHCN